MAGRGILGVIRRIGGATMLTLVSARTGVRLAVVVGSDAFVGRALLVSGLSAPIRPLAKHRDRSGLAFVRRKPANGGA